MILWFKVIVSAWIIVGFINMFLIIGYDLSEKKYNNSRRKRHISPAENVLFYFGVVIFGVYGFYVAIDEITTEKEV